MILDQAIFAKNSMMGYNGSSLFLRTFGVDLNMLPSLETESVVISDNWLRQQVETIKNVRKAYLEAEANEKIKTALSWKADSLHVPIPVGTQALYYGDGKKCGMGWHCSVRIIDRKGVEYTVKHGKSLISVHKRDIRKFRSSHNFEKKRKGKREKN